MMPASGDWSLDVMNGHLHFFVETSYLGGSRRKIQATINLFPFHVM
jgi:hypothetical protein